MKKPKCRKQKLRIECRKYCRNIAVYTHPDFDGRLYEAIFSGGK